MVLWNINLKMSSRNCLRPQLAEPGSGARGFEKKKKDATSED